MAYKEVTLQLHPLRDLVKAMTELGFEKASHPVLGEVSVSQAEGWIASCEGKPAKCIMVPYLVRE